MMVANKELRQGLGSEKVIDAVAFMKVTPGRKRQGGSKHISTAISALKMSMIWSHVTAAQLPETKRLHLINKQQNVLSNIHFYCYEIGSVFARVQPIIRYGINIHDHFWKKPIRSSDHRLWHSGPLG